MKFIRTPDNDFAFPFGTKTYKCKNLIVAVAIEKGLYHLSISHPSRLPEYIEIKEARYQLCPDGIYMAQIFPPQVEFINMHKNCIHLFQLSENEMVAIK